MKKIMIVAACVFLTACSDSDTAVKALKGAGYSDIRTTGYSWFSCGKDDTFSTGFVAKGPTGVEVKGAVCSTLITKGATIRTF